MTRPVITTQRLELRPMTPEHLPLHRELDTDPAVMRYLLGRSRTAAESDEFWAPRCAEKIADAAGLGWWVGFVDDSFVGWWDLGRSDSEPGDGVKLGEAEIGWRVLRSQWGKGLAPEGATALLHYAFETVGLDRAWAETMAVNTPSRRVMEKIGMQHIATEVRDWDDPLPGSELGEVTYEITKADWTHPWPQIISITGPR
ncbi:GNAT family N-acetyltransferase [Propionimicrobium sp. PCR01-08-3]|uniref:GNAT family N-acetyltransferase n=1 Tax=Propionimicrobium sp. PCR01-08-3 TaxID=3052086 RepID=UPI00255D10E0|nr:GNAT family N-acetyltransferase [Propionimicrobium sp. PCR01-08-3]WIY82217.1 GNAT family N-acetyltransferase [Propionimicrobium sp. PCR01-08-3]